MDNITDKQFPVGRRYRTLKAVDLILYDYDLKVVSTVLLPIHSIFQPWEPFNTWRGNKVPITLGDSAEAFDWGVIAGTATFFPWNDFFSSSELANEPGLWDVVLDLSEQLRVQTLGLVRARQENSPSLRQIGFIPSQELFDTDNQGRTRLFYAAKHGKQEQVESMINRFPGTGFYPQRLGFIERKDEDGLTAADVAEHNGHVEVAKFLRYQAWFIENYG